MRSDEKSGLGRYFSEWLKGDPPELQSLHHSCLLFTLCEGRLQSGLACPQRCHCLMPNYFDSIRRATRGLLVVSLTAALLACATAGDDDYSSALGIYRPDVLQGNVVTAEQVAVLKTGMTRAQVTRLLGTPLLKSAFHANRWDYVFSRLSVDATPQKRRLSLWFEGDLLAKFEGDDMPTEAKFVDSIAKPIDVSEPVKLQADPAELEAFKAKAGSSGDASPTGTTAPAPASTLKTYPPLTPEVNK